MTEVLIIGGSDAGDQRRATRPGTRPGERSHHRRRRRVPELQHLRTPVLPQRRDARLARPRPPQSPRHRSARHPTTPRPSRTTHRPRRPHRHRRRPQRRRTRAALRRDRHRHRRRPRRADHRRSRPARRPRPPHHAAQLRRPPTTRSPRRPDGGHHRRGIHRRRDGRRAHPSRHHRDRRRTTRRRCSPRSIPNSAPTSLAELAEPRRHRRHQHQSRPHRRQGRSAPRRRRPRLRRSPPISFSSWSASDPTSSSPRTAGVELGERGAIPVDRSMRTNVPDVYAAGDCVHTWHQPHPAVHVHAARHAPPTNKDGVAGENAVGGRARIRRLARHPGRQDLRSRRRPHRPARTRSGRRPASSRSPSIEPFDDHKAYYPGATPLQIRLTGDRATDGSSAPNCSATTAPKSPNASTSTPPRSTTA